jgi:hypothetical protein
MNLMNVKDDHETSDQSIVIEDLSAQNAEEIKGGPQATLDMFTARYCPS